MIHERIDERRDPEPGKMISFGSHQSTSPNGVAFAPKKRTAPAGKKTGEGVCRASYPAEFVATVNSLKGEILKRYPEGGAAAVELRGLCERHGISLSGGARLLGMGQSTLDRRVHLYEDFAEIYSSLKEVMPKITEPHLRELSKIADRHAALACLIGAVSEIGEKLSVHVLRKYISDRAREDGLELRTRRPRRRSPAGITKLIAQTRDAAMRWNPDHPAIGHLNAAITSLAI